MPKRNRKPDSVTVTELDPCPFCGHTSSIVVPDPKVPVPALDIGDEMAYCSNKLCGAQLTAPTMKEAFTRWNRRAYAGLVLTTKELRLLRYLLREMYYDLGYNEKTPDIYTKEEKALFVSLKRKVTGR